MIVYTNNFTDISRNIITNMLRHNKNGLINSIFYN